ncbi:L-seryl-tRNA(Sec) selenium transferase, partial [candidate division KSB1 bacterium]|nr:L-seryl-tRNA(Sec) selenium transferase [candidate division KSB1 bacterium]
KTHLHDYTKALNPNTGGLLVVHTSNYRVQGFTAQIELSDAVRIARENNLFVLHDLGGGILLDFESIGLPKEPLVSESIEKGADIVTFSGDKVIGGPQCGILVGKKEAIAKIRKNPLMRALRCDKITYSLLGSTLQIFLQENKSVNNHLVLSQFTTPVEDVQKRAELLLSSLTEVGFDNFSFSIEKANAQAGSGTLPLEKLPSYALVIKSKTNINNLAKTLRTSNPAIIGYLNSDKLFLDMRSCLQVDLTDLISVLHTTLKELNY